MRAHAWAFWCASFSGRGHYLPHMHGILKAPRIRHFDNFGMPVSSSNRGDFANLASSSLQCIPKASYKGICFPSTNCSSIRASLISHSRSSRFFLALSRRLCSSSRMGCTISTSSSVSCFVHRRRAANDLQSSFCTMVSQASLCTECSSMGFFAGIVLPRPDPISHAQAMRVSPARCRLQRLHDVPCVEGTSLQCVHPTAGGDRVAFRADNAREHTCKPARAKVRFAKSCVCRSGEGLHLTLARSGQLSCCHVRYSFSASKCMRAIRKYRRVAV